MVEYKTSDIARIIGVHPNTVRFYEAMALISPARRLANGYRVFTDLHLDQFRLARSAFAVEIIHHGLRGRVVEIIKTSARGAYGDAIALGEAFLRCVQTEMDNAEEAIAITRGIWTGAGQGQEGHCLKRGEAAARLGVTAETLRNWERNGLLCAGRKKNGYRVYGEADLRRLKIIRTLRHAGYSIASVLRLLGRMDQNPDTDIQAVLNTPGEDDDIVLACDQFITSLQSARDTGREIITQLGRMKEKYG